MKAAVSSLFGKLASAFRRLFSALHKPIQKLSSLPPCKKIDSAFQKAWKGDKPREYRFLPYVTTVLRALGWAVLVIGVIASVLFGLQVLDGGLTVGGIKLMGIGAGVCVILLGIVGSFLAWLFLLVNRELVYLFIHVKDNTGSTAERLTEDQD